MIHEALQTPITKSCDVLVCGGGFGGVAAALAAARHGQRVILLEKQYMLGGLGTAGLITIHLPLCDGMGRQVSFGIAEELLKLSISMGAEGRYPANWLDSADPAGRNEQTPRYMVQYNPHLCAIMMEQLLLREGVEILYGSYAVAADCEAERIRAVMVESVSGRQAIRAKTFVDATGNADIAHFAHAPTEPFHQGNVLAAWYYFLDQSGYGLREMGCADIPEDQKAGGAHVETLRSERFTGLDADEVSRMVQYSHASILADVQKRRRADASAVPVTIASIPQLRMTRRIVGEYTLHDTEMHKSFADSVGMIADWRRRGPVYEVPFRTLYSAKVRNLITAGRCTSVTDSMWDLMRVIPCCAVTGQAAGTAAALTEDFSALDVSVLQDALSKDGVLLHE